MFLAVLLLEIPGSHRLRAEPDRREQEEVACPQRASRHRAVPTSKG